MARVSTPGDSRATKACDRRVWVRLAVLLLCPAVAVPQAAGETQSLLQIENIEPTVFFVDHNGSLLQVAEIAIRNGFDPVPADVVVELNGHRRIDDLGKVNTGRGTYRIHVPDVSGPRPVEIILRANGREQNRETLMWQPQRHWEVYHVPIAHHDWGYTQTPDDVLETYCRMFDEILDYCDQTADWPVESQFRYMVEECWSILHYAEHSPADKVEKLARYVQEGRIEIPALLGNQISGMCGHEELVRLVYPAFRLKQLLGADISAAGITDVPGLSWGLPTLLADVGVRYFYAGMPSYYRWGHLDVPDFWDEEAVLRHGTPDAFWWQGPDGGKVLVYYQGGYGCWLPKTYDEALAELPQMLEDLEAKGCPFSVVRYGGHGCHDNAPANICDASIAREWNRRWAYPKLIVATHTMFFDALEKQCDDLRTFRGELPHTDYVVGALSSAKETGINRLTRDRLAAAERFRTISCLLEGTRPPRERVSDAYRNLLMYDEHTWGMARNAGPVQDWNWSEKASCAYRASAMAEFLLWAGLERIAARIGVEATGPHVVVFNPLSTERTDVVRPTLMGWPEIPDYVFEGRFDLIDVTTGRKVPWQMVKLDNPSSPVPFAPERYARGHMTNHAKHLPYYFQDELYEIVFVAEKVPPVGYRTYRAVPRIGASVSDDSQLRVSGNTLENRFYRVTLDPQSGGAASVFDKQMHRELIDVAAPHKANEPVVRWIKDLTQAGPQGVTIRQGAHGAVYASLLVETELPGCPKLTQEVILYDQLKRIDFNNRVLKDYTPHMELYFAFPFAVEDPQFSFEATHSVMRPFMDQFPGSNTNYYSVQHWAEVSDGELSVVLTPVESHLMEFGGIWPCRVSQAHHGVTSPAFDQPFITPEQVKRGYLYSFALISSFRTNFRATQQGDVLFRYSLTTREGAWPAGGKRDFGLSVTTPLIPLGIGGKQRGSLEGAMSFCRLDRSNVFLTAFKEAEDGRGLIVRLIETEGTSSVVTLTLPLVSIRQAWQTNAVEEDRAILDCSEHTVQLPVKPHEIVTIRLLQKQDVVPGG